MDNQTLEMIIKASADAATKAVKTLKKELGNFKEGFQDASGAAASFANVIWSLGKISLGAVINTFNKLYDSIKSASDRAEELNLFNVVFKNITVEGKKAFSELGLEATKFQNKLNEAFGTNMTDTLRYQALFQSMGENSGIKDKYANIMSENLTKMTYDLASLYNRSEKETAEALKSGIYAGQTKPMRKYGVDVTQGSLSPLLTQLGITDRSISQMSQAEKQILRYIGTMNQAKVAMKDFAQTIESPANQLKVLRNQFAELKVAVGNLFLGMFQQILPYANAILMVLKELAKAIASFFGISISDYNSGAGALEENENAWEGVGAGANKATKAAKEYKKQILSFDQIHNLTTPTSSGSGGGGGAGNLTGGIDKRLLDAIKGYDNLMDKVKMKATILRDRWMEILGFKKVINPLTGEVSFKYQGFSTTVKNLAEQFSKLSSKAKLFISLGVAVALGKIYSKAKTLLGIVGKSGLLGDTIDLIKWARIGVGVEGNLTKGLSEGINAWREQHGIIGKNTTAFSRFTSGVGEFVKGLGVAAGGFLVLNTGLEDMQQNGIGVINSLEAVGGVLGTTFGAAQMGAVFGPWGAAIGGGIGLIGSLITAISGISSALDEEQRALDNAAAKAEEDWERQRKSAESAKESMLMVDSEMAYYENLKNELDSIVDKNGKIKAGYEDRAKVITGILSEAFGIEIKIVDGVIVKYGELKQKIEDVMKQKTAMAKMEILEDKWKEATQNLSVAEKALEDDYKTLTGLYREQDEIVAQLAEKYGLTEEQIRDMLPSIEDMSEENWELMNSTAGLRDEIADLRPKYNTLTNQIDEATETWKKHKDEVDDNKETLRLYEQAYKYVLDENYDALDDFIDKEAQAMGMSQEERNTYYADLQTQAIEHKKYMQRHQSEYTKEEYDRLVAADDRIIAYTNEFFDSWKTIYRDGNGEISDDTVSAWIEMGNKSTEEALKEFKKLPRNLQDELYDKMVNSGKEMSGKLQEGLNNVRITKTVEVDANMTKANNKLSSFTNSQAFKKAFELIGITAKANGGIFGARGWSNIPQFANGGAPSHGTLFAAGENGAEIVGNINRRTEVLNRSQIASAIYSAVASAMSNANLGGGEVHLYAHTDEGVIIDRINSKTKQTGRCPINIPA